MRKMSWRGKLLLAKKNLILNPDKRLWVLKEPQYIGVATLLRYSSVRGVNKWERIWYTWYLYWTECKRVYKGTENWRDWRLIGLIAHGPKFWRERWKSREKKKEGNRKVTKRRKSRRGKEERGVATWGGGGCSLTPFPRDTPRRAFQFQKKTTLTWNGMTMEMRKRSFFQDSPQTPRTENPGEWKRCGASGTISIS